jgi:nuclear pore complex protein Nup62
MTFRQLEDQINIWLNELNQMEAEFHLQAQTINSWDSLLINNGLKITQINETLEKLRTDHTRLDHQLDFIIAQQNELEQLLTPIESNKFEMSSNNAVNAEREFIYSMVETVHNDLNGIGSDLKVSYFYIFVNFVNFLFKYYLTIC